MHLPPRRLRSLAFVFGVEPQACSGAAGAEPPARDGGPQVAPGNVDSGEPDRDEASRADQPSKPMP
jgi:hypothetical protein